MRSRASTAALTVTAVTALLAATIGIAGASNGDIEVKGKFESVNFSGTGCPSPVDACARGTFAGSLHGPITAVATTIAPTTTSGVLVGVADLVIHDRKGDLFCTETFVVDVSEGADASEGFICRFTGGTGRWTGVSGHIEAFSSTLPGRSTTGGYVGMLTLP